MGVLLGVGCSVNTASRTDEFRKGRDPKVDRRSLDVSGKTDVSLR
jgi:hypothetical protein